MKSFQFFPIKKTSLKVLFSLALLLLCSLALLLIQRISNMNKASDLVNNTNVVRLALSETLSMLKDAEAEQRGFILSHDSVFLENCNTKKECLNKHLDTLRKLVKNNPVQLQQFDTLKTLVHKRMHLLQDVMTAYGDSALPTGPHLKDDLLRGKEAMDAVKYRLLVMDNIEQQLLKQRTSTSNYYGLTTPLYAVFLTSVALLIIIFAFSKLGKLLNLSDKQSQHANKQAAQRAYLTEQVVEHNIDMVLAVDTQLRLTIWSKAMEEAFGLSKDEVMGRKITDVFPYLQDDIKLQLTKAALQGKETLRTQVKFLNNQKVGQASYIPLKNTEGAIEGVLIITHDITELKQTTQLLKESNLRYEQAEQVGKLGSYHRNIQTGEAVMSDNMYRMFELEKGSVMPTMQLFIDMLHPDDKQRTLEAVHKHETSGIITPVRCRIIRKDGSIMHVKISALPLYNDKGEMVIYGSVMDVTEEEQLKQQLEQRTNLLESVIENSTELIAAIDTDMHYILVNEAHQKVLGISTKDMLGKKVLEVFPQLENYNNYKLIQEALKGYPSYNIEFGDLKTGVIAEINHIPLKDHEGNVTGVLVVAHDITERKKAARKLEKTNTELQLRNKALQEAYAFNQHITDLAPNGIYVYDINEITTIFTNKKMVELHGYSAEELNDMGPDLLNNLVHPDDLSHIYNELKRFDTATDRDVIELEYRMRNKAGQYRNVICRESVFARNDKGEPEQFIGVAIDVTDVKNAEKELKQKNKQLLQSNEELTSFNYVASHDLQEPLRKIQTFANFLEESETALSDQGKISLKRMQSAAARMRDLIKDLLAFSRIEMEKEAQEPVDLNIILKMAKSSLRSSIDEKGASIVPDSLPVIQGVAFKLQQLFENIIGNAVKYSVPGIAPIVNITCNQVVAAKDNNMGLQDGATYHHICFQDNGIGFEQQYADKIFELFQRLHTQNEFPGTGLGLAICKRIVQVHDGHIQASSTPGEGSLFEIFLPVAEVPLTPTRPRQLSPSG